MKIIVPDYYKEFKCIAEKCRHTCCKGWEVEIDDESLFRFEQYPEIAKHIEKTEDNHFALLEDEVCPFLQKDGLCSMILHYGEDMLCQTCTDHPRFRNYFSDRIEMGLGMVCEEAARLILSKQNPMSLEILSDNLNDDGNERISHENDVNNYNDAGCDDENQDDLVLPEDEAWLLGIRDELLKNVELTGPLARLKEYLIFRHIPNALYDDRLEERIAFVDFLVDKVESEWKNTDGSLEALIEVVRVISYDVEYDEDQMEMIIGDGANVSRPVPV